MSLEIEIIRLFNSYPQFDAFFKAVGFITAHILWVLVFLVLYRMDKHISFTYGAGLIALIAIVLLLEELIARPRPDPETVRRVVIVSTYAFPSMHAAISSYTATFVHGAQHDRKITAFFVLVAILVYIDRLALGVHYPSDIIAGAIFGYLGALIIMRFRSSMYRFA